MSAAMRSESGASMRASREALSADSRAAASSAGTDDAALDAAFVVRRGGFELDARLQVRPGEIIAILGPNGSGKSTLLQAVAGLLPLDSGTVTAAGRVLSRRETSRTPPESAVDAGRRHLHVAPEHRGIGLLGQDPLLFPHLSALENVAFGQRAHGVPKTQARREALDWLRSMQLSEFSGRRPAQLSGGQQQRVAIARALAARPSLLLLDEPMAALDVQSAPQIRLLLREQLGRSGTAAILVTHDVLDAIVLADRLLILDHGRIVDQGPTAEVLARPRNRFVADLVGVNLVEGTMVRPTAGAGIDQGADAAMENAAVMRTRDGRVVVGHVVGIGGGVQPTAGREFGTQPGMRALDEDPIARGTPVHAVFRPSAVRVEPARWAPGETMGDDAVAVVNPRSAPTNRWEATVVLLEPASGGIRIRTDDPAGVVAELPATEVASLGLEPGSGVWLSVAADDVAIHAVARSP